MEPLNIAFGNCVLESGARQLWRNGQIVSLEPKMYDLLEILIRRRPSVVTAGELDEVLWPKAYVARTSRTRLISELRSRLGDSPKTPRIIRTVAKKGYSFCATVNYVKRPLAPITVIIVVWNEQLIPLSEGEHIAGRGTDCSILIDATTVSRRHALIRVASSASTIEDLSSKNGTHVEGVRIVIPTQIVDGTKIGLGREILTVRKPDSFVVTETINGDHTFQLDRLISGEAGHR